MCKRYPHPTTVKNVRQRLSGSSTRILAAELNLPPSASATLSRIARGEGGISAKTESLIRQRLELDDYRKPRKSRGFDADLITLFDMERDRRGLTNSEYLAALMGVSST